MEMRTLALLGVALSLLILLPGPANSTAASVGGEVQASSGGDMLEIDYRGPETHSYIPPPELNKGTVSSKSSKAGSSNTRGGSLKTHFDLIMN